VKSLRESVLAIVGPPMENDLQATKWKNTKVLVTGERRGVSPPRKDFPPMPPGFLETRRCFHGGLTPRRSPVATSSLNASKSLSAVRLDWRCPRRATCLFPVHHRVVNYWSQSP